MKNQSLSCVLTLLMVVSLTGIDVATAVQADTAGTAFTREQQAAITPTRALDLLKEGNARFVSGETVKRDYSVQVK